MGMHTYTTTLNGKTVEIKAKKEVAEAIAAELAKPIKIRRYFKEIRGVIGESERSTILWSPFGPDRPVTDEEGYKAALEEYVQGLPLLITQENAPIYLQQAKEIFEKHIPIVDERETKEQVVIRQAQAVVMQRERELEEEAWRAKWCKADKIDIPEGMMAVYLRITFDDSDMMVDYFAPHMPLGDAMLLAIVPKQPQTQALARRVLGGYPELTKLKWEWHVENYSMGHGNYLMSEPFGTEKHHAYDGREEVAVSYEIQFNHYAKSMYAYKDYPGTQGMAAEPAKVGEVTIRRNEEHSGIEVIFPAKPDTAVLEGLKGLGFRWSRPQGLWYARYSEELLKQTENLLGKEVKDNDLSC